MSIVNDKPTPETDAEIKIELTCACYTNEYVSVDFPRKLERERDEAREKIKNQAKRIRVLEGATNHACGTPLTRALRERDEALRNAAMWKANHDNQVALKAMLMERPDLGDRAARIAELIRERDEWAAMCGRYKQERDEAREDLESEKNTRNAIIEKGLKLEKQLREMQEALEYIANAGLSARHIEDYAKEFLSKK